MSAPESAAPFDRAKALFTDGLRSFGAGRFAEAEQQFEGSLAALPGRVSTLVNLAATKLQLGRPQQALDAADQVLAAEPDNADAWLHRGSALEALGRWEDSLQAFERTVALNAKAAEPWLRRGRVLERLNRLDEALASHDRALAIDPTCAEAWSRRGGLLREMHRLDEAAQAFERAVAHGGEPELTGYYLAAVGARDAVVPPTAPRHYVRSLFDDYAGEFDAHLVGALGYRGHIVLATHLKALAADRLGGRFRAALDLGCGTGLCGPLVRPTVDRLTGVDLSAAMLEQARALGVYDRLERGEIVEHLAEHGDERYDAVLAADVFIYVGDLAPVFEAVRRRIDAGGVFCFSVERAQDDGPAFTLLPSLRYAHAERYVRELAARAGFDVLRIADEPIRLHRGKAVDSMFVTLRGR